MNVSKILVSAVVVSLVGCGATTPSKPAPAPAPVAPVAVADCVFPQTSTPAPGWICDEPVPGIDISAVGVSEPSKAGMSFMKDIAAADARGQLAEQFKAQASKMVKKYLGTTGTGSRETVDAAAESVVKTVSDAVLTGSRIFKSRTGPNGRLFVLVGLDSEANKEAVADAIMTSMNDDQALWQQFQAGKAHKELAADIAKQKVR